MHRETKAEKVVNSPTIQDNNDHGGGGGGGVVVNKDIKDAISISFYCFRLVGIDRFPRSVVAYVLGSVRAGECALSLYLLVAMVILKFLKIFMIVTVKLK